MNGEISWNMSDVEIHMSPKRVANLLKVIVNRNCADGFKWYEEIGTMPTMWDLQYAIEILEKEEDAKMTVHDK